MPSSSGPSTAIDSPRQARPRARARGSGTPDGRRSRCGRRGTSRGYPAGVPAVCTYSILPESLEALARALAGEIGFPGRLPVAVAVAGRPMTLLDEILEQPEVAARFLADQAGRDRVDRRRPAPPDRDRSATSSSPRAARRTTPRSTPSTCSASGIGLPVGARDAVDRVGVRRRARLRRLAGHRDQPVGRVAGHRRRSSPRPGAGRADASRSPTSPIRPSRRPRTRTIALGAGPELAVAATKTYTAELLAVACAVGGADRRPRRPGGRGGHPRRRSPRCSSSSPDIERDRRGPGRRRRATLVIARGYEYATAREWALKLKELAQVFADPYSAADFQHGPLALVEPGVPVLAVARPGPTETDLVALLERLRTDLDAAVMVVSDVRRRAGSTPWPVELPGGTPEWLGPIVSIVAGPAPRATTSPARGLDPGASAEPAEGDANDLTGRRLGYGARQAGHWQGARTRDATTAG